MLSGAYAGAIFTFAFIQLYNEKCCLGSMLVNFFLRIGIAFENEIAYLLIGKILVHSQEMSMPARALGLQEGYSQDRNDQSGQGMHSGDRVQSLPGTMGALVQFRTVAKLSILITQTFHEHLAF